MGGDTTVGRSVAARQNYLPSRSATSPDPRPACTAATTGRGDHRARAEPIDKRTAKNGATSYHFMVDVGTKPDGTRDRQRFTYRT